MNRKDRPKPDRDEGWSRKVLIKYWNKFQTNLILEFSPLNSFLYQLWFMAARQMGNFERRSGVGLDWFYKLGAHGQMYNNQKLMNILGMYPWILFQCSQVQGLVQSLNRQAIVSHPLKEFELLLTSQGKGKNLCNVYRMFLQLGRQC